MTGGAIAIQDSGCARSLEEVKERLGVLFARIEPRRAVWAYLDGLLSGVERKTGWQLAERAGDPGPWRIQAVLGRGRWMPMPRATSSGHMSSGTWGRRMAFWWSTRRGS